jgi:zinc transport system permease protein
MLQNPFMQNAFLVGIFIAVLCPCIGIFLVLRRYSMIGDTLAHASLAGISIALSVGGSPLLGAFAFTAACGALIEFLRGYFKKNTDLILSVVLALCVGVAITLISSGRVHANTGGFLFGSLVTVTRADTVMALALSALSVLTLALFYNQLLYIAYDEEAAKVAGVPVRVINYVFSVLVAAAVSVAIRVVGVMVLSSMIALPVAAALQLGRGFRATLAFSVAFSVVDILLGLTLAYYLDVAAGGFTAIVSVAVLFLVIIFKKISQKLRGGAI